MHDVMQKRLMRKLESLPEDKLYQVLDYIEFLESKYGVQPTRPGVVQRFGERLEDGLRALSMGPKAVTGTMRVVGLAGRVLDGISEAGREIVKGIEDATTAPPRPRVSPPRPDADVGVPAGSDAVPHAGEPARIGPASSSQPREPSPGPNVSSPVTNPPGPESNPSAPVSNPSVEG